MELKDLVMLLENSSKPGSTIDKFDFFYVKTDKLFRLNIDEDRLLSHFEYRVTVVSNEFFAHELKSLANAIKKAEFGDSDHYFDARYALILYRGEKRICSLFQDGQGSKVSFNYKIYKTNGELNNWFKSIANRLVSVVKRY